MTRKRFIASLFAGLFGAIALAGCKSGSCGDKCCVCACGCECCKDCRTCTPCACHEGDKCCDACTCASCEDAGTASDVHFSS